MNRKQADNTAQLQTYVTLQEKGRMTARIELQAQKTDPQKIVPRP